MTVENADLIENVVQVVLNGLLADEEYCRYFLVAITLRPARLFRFPGYSTVFRDTRRIWTMIGL